MPITQGVHRLLGRPAAELCCLMYLAMALAQPAAAPALPGGRAAGSRAGSLLPGASMDLTLLELASSASADLRFRRAESLLSCGLTADEVGGGWE